MTLETNLTAAFQAVGADMKGLQAKTVGRIPYDCTVDGSGGFQQGPTTSAAGQALRTAGRDIIWHITATATLAATTAGAGYLDGVDGVIASEQRVYFSTSGTSLSTVGEFVSNFPWATPDSDPWGMFDAGYLIAVPAGQGGVYTVDWQIGFANNTTGVRSAILKKRPVAGGGDVTVLDKPAVLHPTDYTIVSATTVLELAAGDKIFWSTFQNSGGDLGVGRCHVHMARVSV